MPKVTFLAILYISLSWVCQGKAADTLTLTHNAGGSTLVLKGAASATYAIQTSENLAFNNWSTLGAVTTDPQGCWQGTDAENEVPRRFYRARFLTSVNQMNFYVDSATGSDDNAGTSSAAPFQTLSAARTALLAAGSGSTLNLKRGDLWRESLDLSAADHLTVQAYGDPALPRPIIAADDVVPTGGWGLVSGQSHTYQCVWAAEDAAGNHYVTVWENGGRMAWATSVSACEAAPNSCFFDFVNHLLYIHPSDGGNPATNGKTYEATRRIYALLLHDDSSAISLCTRRQSSANGSFEARYRGLALDCWFLDGVKHCALMASGEYSGCYAAGIETGTANGGRTSSYIMEFFGGNLTGQTAAYTHCVFVGPGGLDARQNEVQAMGGHSDGTFWASMTVTDCTARDLGVVFGFGGFPITVTRLRADHCALLIENDGATITVIDPYATDVMALFGGGSGTTSVTGLRAVLGAGQKLAQTGGTFTLSIDRSAVYVSAVDVGTRLVIDGGSAAGSTCTVTRTAVVSVAASSTYAYESYNDHLSYLGNHNAFYPSAGFQFLVGSANPPGFVGYGSVAAYLAAQQPSGNEAGSLVSDAQFADPAGNNWTVGNSAVSAIGAGCERPRVGYTGFGAGDALPLAPAITSPATWTITQGTPSTFQIMASNNPTGFGAAGLPAGVTLNLATGLLSYDGS